MDPDKITLDCLMKNFEYERISREVDSCENIEQVKNIAKSFIKLYLQQQEVMLQIGSIDGKTL
jgi:hypothetical protein